MERGKTIPNIDFVDTKYGNNYGWLTLKSFLSPKLYARTLLYAGSVTQKRFWDQFDDDPEGNLNSANINDNRDFKLFGLKQDWSYEASERVFIKLGMDLKKLNVDFNYSNSIMNEFIAADGSLIDQISAFEAAKTVDGSQIGLYLASRFQIFTPLTLETGLRYDYASYTGDKLWSPRISMVYALGKATFLRAGWGHYYQTQGIDDLRIEFGETSYHPAELPKHYVAGFEHLFANGLQLRAEGYVKKISNLRDKYITFRNIDEFFAEARDDLIKLIVNEATTKGIELYLKYDTGNKFSWWVSYVLSDAQDDILDIQYDGRLVKQTGTLPRFWDQRHTINLDANYRLNRSWHFNFAWQYRSGWPYTEFEVRRVARDDGTFAYYHDYGLFNDRRYPAYHRFDTRINKHFFTSKGKITAFLHIINSYNHENINNFDFSILEENADSFRFEIDNETWFSILPFIGVSWEF